MTRRAQRKKPRAARLFVASEAVRLLQNIYPGQSLSKD